MKLVLFHQYDQLLAKIREVARCCARDAADWKICRVSASNGSVHLHDRTMNVLSVSGGETRIVVPDIEPERANIPQSEGLPRSGALAGVQFCLRVTAEGDNTLTFTGAEAFEAAAARASSVTLTHSHDMAFLTVVSAVKDVARHLDNIAERIETKGI